MARSCAGASRGAAAPASRCRTGKRTSPATCGWGRPVADDTTTAEPEADEAPAPPEPPTLHGCPVVTERGCQIVHCTAEQYLALITALKDDGYAFCSDLCAVDYLAH